MKIFEALLEPFPEQIIFVLGPIAALLSEVTWEDLESPEDRDDLVRLLGSNLLVPAPFAALAMAIAELLSDERGSNDEVHKQMVEETWILLIILMRSQHWMGLNESITFFFAR